MFIATRSPLIISAKSKMLSISLFAEEVRRACTFYKHYVPTAPYCLFSLERLLLRQRWHRLQSVTLNRISQTEVCAVKQNERDLQRPRSFLLRLAIAYAPRTTVNTISSANSTSDSISARPRIIIV